jgi:hypothetical protein
MLLLTASFLLILGGVAYWLYSFIEAQQRKMGVLENVLYELRFALQERRVTDDSHGVQLSNSPPETDVTEQKQEQDEEEKVVGIQRYVEPPESVAGEVENTMKDFEIDLPSMNDEVGADDLRPGGVLDLNEDEVLKGWNTKKPTEDSEFKKLFVGSVGDDKSTSSPLESLPTKQLREMAQERGLRVSKSMKKPELLELLRSSAGPVATQNVVRRLEEAE